MDTIDAAIGYISRGFAPVPIPSGSKKPLVKDWPNFRVLEDDAGRHFYATGNVGIILGAASGGLVDIDLDCDEAVRLAAETLPETAAIFGRKGRPRSHHLFRVVGGCPTKKFLDPIDGKNLLELRGDGGLQTVFPPSRHPSGETVTWESEGAPALIDYDVLLGAIKCLAGNVVIEKHGDAARDNSTVREWLGLAPVKAEKLRNVNSGRNNSSYAQSALDRECAIVAGVGEGGRNDQLNKSSFNIGQLVAGGELDEHIVVDALLAAARQCGLTAAEATKTIRSGITKGTAHPRQRPESGAASPRREDSSDEDRGSPHPGGTNSESPRDNTQPREAPRPLRRELSPAEPFPIAALGELLGAAAQAIIDKVQCPDAIAACSVLAAGSMAVQAYADVVLPATGRARPLSLLMCTVAATGERKSAGDHEALWPIRKREENLREEYEAELPDFKRAKRAFDVAVSRAEKIKGGRREVEAALRAVGDEPPAPLIPVLTCGEPTLEGLHKLFAGGHPALGLFSDEGGSFIGGHAMSDETRLRTVAGLSSMWDGAPIRRIRAGDGVSVLPGRRLALHLMAQPDAAARMLSDEVLLDQGFLSRMLVAAPNSTAGTRFQKTLSPETEPALRRYGARLLDILETPPVLLAGTRNALEPRRLEFDDAAKTRWLQFADYIEALLAPGKPLEPIRGFANKLPEHVARIAGVLTLVEDIDAHSISLTVVEQAIKLAEFFTTEALRLFEAGHSSAEQRQAAKLLEWLKTAWTEPLIGLSTIYRMGPNSIRDKATAKAAVAVLEDHGWLQKYREQHPVVGGNPVREAWRIVREN